MEFKRFYKFISVTDVGGQEHLINADDISDLYIYGTSSESRYYIQLRSKANGPDIEIDAAQHATLKRDLVRRYDAVVL